MVKKDGMILEKQHRRAVTSFPFREGFLSPVRGTERVVKPIVAVSIRSTPYCKSQNNVVPLHGGIIFLILRQEYAV